MNQRIQIRFREPEIVVSAELRRKDAPIASELLWGILETPFRGRAVHAMYAGPAVLVDIPERHGEPRWGQIPVENETNQPEPGDVMLLPPAPDDDDIGTGPVARVTVAIFYGEGGRPFTPAGWQPGVVVARVTEGFDELREACRRTRYEGARAISLGREMKPGDVTEAIVYADGASLGNPGAAGAGFVIISRDGQMLSEGSEPLGSTTVNVAEYRALIGGLDEAGRLGVRKLQARVDSELVCKQLNGQYRVKAEHLRPLYQEARRLIAQFEAFKCIHVPREQNERADALAGAAAKRSKEQLANGVE